MRIFNDQLIINAPDFIHRQIDGYPAAIPSHEADDQSASQSLPPQPAASPMPQSSPPVRPAIGGNAN